MFRSVHLAVTASRPRTPRPPFPRVSARRRGSSPRARTRRPPLFSRRKRRSPNRGTPRASRARALQLDLAVRGEHAVRLERAISGAKGTLPFFYTLHARAALLDAPRARHRRRVAQRHVRVPGGAMAGSRVDGGLRDHYLGPVNLAGHAQGQRRPVLARTANGGRRARRPAPSPPPRTSPYRREPPRPPPGRPEILDRTRRPKGPFPFATRGFRFRVRVEPHPPLPPRRRVPAPAQANAHGAVPTLVRRTSRS